MSRSPDRLKHLEFLQSTISRQASNAFAVKGWSITVGAAIYAYTASHLTWWLAIVAILPSVAFAYLDAFYLRQERLFRKLYDDAIEIDTSVPEFSMNTRHYLMNASCTYRGIAAAKTWWMFHSILMLVGVVLFGIAIFQRFSTTELADCIRV
ncbi:MAG: hypothetical protein ACRDHN_19550 [Thermomicrobiales bacterium]